MSKAFDTVNHDLLLKKLERLGIRGIALKMFRSFLEQRQQLTVYNNQESSIKCINIGVPQGSILGPILFLLYINDLPIMTKCLSFLFVDDTSIFLNGLNYDELVHEMNIELQKISHWFKMNRLSLNLEKTHYILFHPVRKKITSTSNILKIDDVNILKVDNIKFLGVVLNSTLTWNDHIFELSSKINKLMGMMYKIKDYVNQTALFNIYSSLVYPLLLYANVVWCTKYDIYVGKIFVLQKHILRLIENKNRMTPSKPLFEKLQIRTIYSVNKLRLAIFTYKRQNFFFGPLLDRLNYNEDIIGRNIRKGSKIFIRRVKYERSKQMLDVAGPIFFNLLPDNIHNLVSFSQFKKKIKLHIPIHVLP